MWNVLASSTMYCSVQHQSIRAFNILRLEEASGYIGTYI